MLKLCISQNPGTNTCLDVAPKTGKLREGLALDNLILIQSTNLVESYCTGMVGILRRCVRMKDKCRGQQVETHEDPHEHLYGLQVKGYSLLW